MGITHEWNGTVLTITSDSGTSSADLQGPKGDDGIRGPQGKCGVIINADGTVDTSIYATEEYVDTKVAQAQLGGGVDLSTYATKSYVKEQIANIEAGSVDLSNYYTKTETDAKIAEAQLSGGEVDLSAYATQEWVNNKGYLTEHQSLKTINGESIVGSGNITISGGSGSITPVTEISSASTDDEVPSAKAVNDLVNNSMDSVLQTANSKYTKPSTGIPASDLASGVIPDVSQYQTAEQVQTLIDNALGVIENGTY